jgi:predicted RNase H-like HicB family nuclease
LEAIVERHDYPIVIEPLPDSEGGGFLATVPDLPGCMSDGRTREEAARAIADAIAAWIEEARQIGCAVPGPSAHLALAGE